MNIKDVFSGRFSQAKWLALGIYLRGQRINSGIGIRITHDEVLGSLVSASIPREYATAAPSCGSLRVFSKTPDGAENPHLYVGPGTVGEDYYDTDTDLGSLDEASDNGVYIKIVLDDTDGTYTDEIVVDSGVESDDTTTYFLLGSVAADGVITQSACGPVYVTVCRNWFAAESPYYGMTVTT